MSALRWPLDRIVEAKIALILFTRLPLRHQGEIGGPLLARALWALPLAGLLVGALAALAYWLAIKLGLPAFVAGILALATSLLVTGCYHEDGLADTADGFGGGRTRERKLEIMRDSGLGTYGTVTLVLALLLRVALLATLARPELVIPVLIASHVAGRALLPAFMGLLPPARRDGLAAAASRPPAWTMLAALALGLAALLLGLGWWSGLIALPVLVMAALLLAWLCLRQIGGYTGDVLGALEQACEILILLVAVARL